MAQPGKHFNEGPEPTAASHPGSRGRPDQLDFELDFFGGILPAAPTTWTCCGSWATS